MTMRETMPRADAESDRAAFLAERISGGLLGLALGDALGVPVEFSTRAEREEDPVRGMRSGGTWKREPGTYSDDASLALCLAESVVLRAFDPEDSGRRALAWLDADLWAARGGAFGCGGATGRALARIRAGTSAVRAGGHGEGDNGNGSLMRILPASVWLASLPEPARFNCLAAYTAVTHGHPRCMLASWLHCLVAAALLRGRAPPEAYGAAMEEARSLLPSLPAKARLEAGAYARVLDGKLGGLDSREIRGSGYVVHCLEAALWCLLTTDGFEDCVLGAVNFGEDADTTGAVAGGLAGLAYGRSALPAEWTSVLARSGEIEALGHSLAALAAPARPFDRSYWLLPGKLLAGPYPYAPAAREARIEALLDAGVTAFVDLTEEGEVLRGLPVLPYRDCLERAADARGIEVEAIRVPIRDMTAAPEGQLMLALREINRLLAAGRTVYLHCLGGIGRTGTVAGSWLVERGLAAPAEAIALIARYRDWPGASRSPETEAQDALIESRRPGPGALAL
jgi:ADP-ribosyl-[dinitrogen reductase] hydrolase